MNPIFSIFAFAKTIPASKKSKKLPNKFLLYLVMCLICNVTLAVTDEEIAEQEMNRFFTCLDYSNKSPKCALDLKSGLARMSNPSERIPAVDYAIGIYEVLVKYKRGEIKTEEDLKIAYGRLQSKYNHDIQEMHRSELMANQRAQEIQIQRQQLDEQYRVQNQKEFEMYMRQLTPSARDNSPPQQVRPVQPTFLNGNCGTVINQNGSVTGYVRCN
jgi:hypothetical protein